MLRKVFFKWKEARKDILDEFMSNVDFLKARKYITPNLKLKFGDKLVKTLASLKNELFQFNGLIKCNNLWKLIEVSRLKQVFGQRLKVD